MIALDLTIGAFARLALRTAKLLQTKILSAIKGDQQTLFQLLKHCQSTVLTQGVHSRVKHWLKLSRRDGIRHRPDVIVGCNGFHPKQALSVRPITA